MRPVPSCWDCSASALPAPYRKTAGVPLPASPDKTGGTALWALPVPYPLLRFPETSAVRSESAAGWIFLPRFSQPLRRWPLWGFASVIYAILPGGPGDSRGCAAPDRVPSVLPAVPEDIGRTAALDPQPAGQGPGVSADPVLSSVRVQNPRGASRSPAADSDLPDRADTRGDVRTPGSSHRRLSWSPASPAVFGCPPDPDWRTARPAPPPGAWMHRRCRRRSAVFHRRTEQRCCDPSTPPAPAPLSPDPGGDASVPGAYSGFPAERPVLPWYPYGRTGFGGSETHCPLPGRVPAGMRMQAPYRLPKHPPPVCPVKNGRTRR